ncbi:class I SAM-dependent methyltransferase [Rhizobium sp. Root1220]|uniref:class I SAM-dependent methyltransferase n=1 Tax=Rhizobium sp. Root1220 TaxID=1736432 RepID=UPI0006F4CAC1|nr:class I SAM-dependent methyltransferase [Rhizobium sp. Root1220]KQV80504.1 SAM-dependent methyltransferase [Rhizobium sp. Root1220]
MASSFSIQRADGYEQLMGRWSKVLAPKFIAFAGLSDREKILDVGCGTGSLTFELAQHARLHEIVAIDFAEIFIDEVKRLNSDSRIKASQADACNLPFENSGFDRALALLVLHFIPEAGKAIAEMRRVVRPGGVVAAAVWDHYGGMPGMRMVVDAVALLSEHGRQLRTRYCFQPMTQPGELKHAFVEQGLLQVTETELLVRMEYKNFDDFWVPIAAGEGPLGHYIASLQPSERDRTAAAVRDAYEAGQTDGPRSYVSIAWACRGIAP